MHANVQLVFTLPLRMFSKESEKTMREMLESEEGKATRIIAIEEAIMDLKFCKARKEEEAQKFNEEGEEWNEKISLVAADFCDELIDYAEQKHADIDKSL